MPSMPFHRFLIFLWASFSSHCETLNVNVEPLPQSMATIKKKVRTEQVLVNTCRNWNPCALWVGMNNNSASIRGCLKLKIGLLYIQQFPLWIYVQKNRKPDVSDTFVARVLITVVRGRGQLDCPHVDERINKMWLHILGYWPALTGKCVLTYTTTRMNLAHDQWTWGHYVKWNKPVAKSQIYCVIPRICPEELNSRRQGTEWWLLGAGEGERGSYCFVGTEFQFGKMKKSWVFGCTTVWIYATLRHCTMSVVKIVGRFPYVYFNS